MNDERPPPDDWLTEDPFADSEDPAARERAERRAEREQRRREKAAKEAGEPPPPPEPPPTEPPKPKRTPEQEFWDEDPAPEPAPPASGAAGVPKDEKSAAEPEGASGAGRAEAEQAAQENARPAGNAGRARLFGRRRREPVPPPPVEPPQAGTDPSPETPASAGSQPPTEQQAPEEPASQPRTEQRPAASSASESPTEPPPAAPPADPASEPSAADPAPTQVQPLPPSADQGSEPPATGRRSESPTGDEQPAPPAAARRSESATADRRDESSPAGDRRPKPPAADREPTSSAANARPKPPAADEQPAPPAADARPEPPADARVPAPVPVGADPTRPATGEHLVPDPQAPDTRGQTSEEWAAVPAARADALDEAFHDEGKPEMAGAARFGRRSGDGGGRRRGGILGALARHPFRIAAVVLLIIVLWFLNGLFEPFHGDGHGKVAVRIPKGASVSEVGDILEKKGVIGGPGLIDASTLFQIRVSLAGKRSDLYAGKFTLQEDMSYGDAIDVLSREPKPVTRPGIAEVLVPPALSRSQVAQLMKEDGIPGKYMKASKRSKLLDPADYGGKDAKSLEGFLFPDTYEVKRKEGVDGVVRRQLDAFKQNIKKVNMKYAKSKNLNVYDVVTIASMIEGEAAKSKEKKKIASVIYNRLHEGMPLGIDATVRFATGNHETPLTESELATDSPYNTYANSGLPAGPINSPALESIQAAAHPANTDFLFYVVNPKSCEEHSFSATEEEFLADVDKYEKAREANDGNAPSTC